MLHCVANLRLGFLNACFHWVFFSCYGKSCKDKQDLCPVFGLFVFIATFAATQVVERSSLELKGNFKPVILPQMEMITLINKPCSIYNSVFPKDQILWPFTLSSLLRNSSFLIIDLWCLDSALIWRLTNTTVALK